MYLNITDHALMRYAQRFEGEQISSDSVFREWKKSNIDKVEKYEKALRILFQSAKFLTEGKYDKNGRISSFYIVEEERVCFVYDKKQQNIVTVYFIDFGMTEEENSQMLAIFLNFISNTKAEKEEFELKWSEELTQLKRKSSALEIEKNEYREKIKKLESEQQLINKQIEFSGNKRKVYEANLQNAYKKIINSIEF